ncbi:putative intracellular multiplication protein IcmJ [Piscirickettsia salmonis]|uniref:Type IV secretion system protein IcmJ n=1 Tax=Piscirickettsia salmonis TaxID=1238 RepID=A0A1L6TE70_PISSA|nr:type IVB secretion system protein IcmJDotN [Piscirickettsia salmonis]AKP72741.1 hypothetical protein PSLF89_615 [Piscirickettsia salmonis LF-89 = ATCC VR-1361]ALB23755.1 type IV secretion system protein IcmJ [Piscirickettsia salmonis]ALY03602.1 hypothetical protein AWE47_12715 [Piscirickettsia salmonis]AMA43167.1 hypothetical protein AWJ11_12945 [Piscirickettsia salmonis]AOS35638.1 hypothetical protein AVM72_10070 [Piscirickettsia salmonis]
MLNLCLQANIGNFIKHERRKRNNNFIKLSKKIADKFEYNCSYCGVNCEKWYEIVNADGNYKNNQHSNLVIACKVCSQCLLIDQYDINYSGEDKLIYLPEISQVELNLMMIAMAKLASVDTENSQFNSKENILSVKTLYSSLSERSELLTKACQVDISHPGFLSFIFKENLKNNELLSSIRIIFSLSRVSGFIS